MRVLFSTTANDGHFGPVVTLARAAVTAGHQVVVAAPASYAQAVERARFDHLPFADAPAELIGPIMARLPSLPPEDADAMVVREVFGRIDAQSALPGLTAALDSWRPDVVVREPAEFGSLAAAERAGVPHVQVSIGMTEMVRLLAELTAEPMIQLSRAAGLPDDGLSHALSSELLLSSVPPALDEAGDEDYDGSVVAVRYADVPAPAEDVALPEWGDPALPLVYVTFGSVTGSLPPFAGVFRQALDGLADLPVRVLLTVGRRVDVAALGPLPPNAHVETWWPQTHALAQASVLLGHGGFGTTMGAVTAGIPQVVAPIFTSDQRANARHVAAAGVGRAVEPGPDVVPRACEEVLTVLADGELRRRAGVLAAAARALPPASAAIRAVGRLVG